MHIKTEVGWMSDSDSVCLVLKFVREICTTSTRANTILNNRGNFVAKISVHFRQSTVSVWDIFISVNLIWKRRATTPSYYVDEDYPPRPEIQ